MADRRNGLHGRHYWPRSDLQQEHGPANQGRVRQEHHLVDPAPHQLNGVQSTDSRNNELGQLAYPAFPRHDDSTGPHSSHQSSYQTSHGHGDGRSARAPNQDPHQAGSESGDRRPYQRVDRATYSATARLSNGDLGDHYRGEASTAPHQAQDPMQRFRNETMRDQAWNGMHSHRPVNPRSGVRGREHEPSLSGSLSLRVENGSSSSFGRPY